MGCKHKLFELFNIFYIVLFNIVLHFLSLTYCKEPLLNHTEKYTDRQTDRHTQTDTHTHTNTYTGLVEIKGRPHCGLLKY